MLKTLSSKCNYVLGDYSDAGSLNTWNYCDGFSIYFPDPSEIIAYNDKPTYISYFIMRVFLVRW